MPRTAYVNGRYVGLSDPAVPVEDRAYQFADGVYEVIEARGGRLVDEERHWARLRRSLGELRIAEPMVEVALGAVARELLRRNRIRDGLFYVQVSRGVARRDHAFPRPAVAPFLVMTARPFDRAAAEKRARDGIAVLSMPDNRWGRVDIKSVSLLPNVLAKQAAREAGAFEALLVDAAGNVTEGSSSNVWIVTGDARLITAPVAFSILRGTVRDVVLELAAAARLEIVERQFSLEEAKAAAEMFVTSATSAVTPVVKLDGQPVGDGRPGPIAARLRAALAGRALTAPAFATAVATG